MLRRLSFCLLIAVTATACSKKDSKDDSDASDQETPNGPGAGNIAITTTDQALKFLQAALASTAEVSADMAATKAGTIAISLAEGSDPNCYHGTPRNDDEKVFIMPNISEDHAGEVNERAPYYASGLWYCHLKNVIPQAFSTPSAVTCAVGDIAYDGSVVGKPVTIDTKASGCFEGMDDIPATLNVLVTASTIDANEYGFDRQLNITMEGGAEDKGSDLNIRMKVTDKEIAFTSWEMRDVQKHAIAARLDTETGTMRFVELENSVSAQSEEDEDRVRNTRIFIKGELDDNGKYTVITHMEGAKAEIFLRKSQAGYSTRFVSMAGNVADGVRTKNYGAPMGETTKGTILPLNIIPDLDYYDWPDGVTEAGVKRTEPHPGCFGAEGVTCKDNAGIALTEDNYKKYFIFPTDPFTASTTSVDLLAWAQTKKAYLTFEASQIADLFTK